MRFVIGKVGWRRKQETGSRELEGPAGKVLIYLRRTGFSLNPLALHGTWCQHPLRFPYLSL